MVSPSRNLNDNTPELQVKLKNFLQKFSLISILSLYLTICNMAIHESSRIISIHVESTNIPYALRIRDNTMKLSKLKTLVSEAVGLTYELDGVVIRVALIDDLEDSTFLLNERVDEYRALILGEGNGKNITITCKKVYRTFASLNIFIQFTHVNFLTKEIKA